MALHFTEQELSDRRQAAIEAITAGGLDGLLMFRQESMYYLTGYDSFGFVFFQCLYLGADGTLTLLTRAPDLRQAQHTSVISDIRIWIDKADATPAQQLRTILDEHRCRGQRLGIELEAYGLTGRSLRMVDAALDGFCELVDASELISRLRVVKSQAELAYVERAAELADAALAEACEKTEPGADEAEILAAMHGAVFRGGGDYAGNEFIIGSGKDALLCRYFSGRRRLDADDQLTLEFAGAYRRYHACLMRTICIGRIPDRQRDMFQACHEALLASMAALKPGEPIGQVFDAHARILDQAGFQDHRLNACGYSLGALYHPNWMDWPMFYTGNPELAAPNMVFFLHMILADSDAGLAMTLGQTVRVTVTGCESLSRVPLGLIKK